MNILETFDLSKSYGKSLAVDQTNLTVPDRSIFGITGPPHAGKTSLLRMLATLSLPSMGDARISGFSLIGSPTRIRRIVGYMPQSIGVYQNMTVNEYLTFFAACYGISKPVQRSLIDDLLQLVDLAHRKDQRVSGLSHGMRQRLSLARALTNDPQLLLLDEPFSNIDPRAQTEMRELITELHKMGKTVILTATTPVDIVGLCTDQAVMDHGKIILSGTADIVVSRLYAHRIIAVKFFGNIEVASGIIAKNTGVEQMEIISSGSAASLPDATGQQELPAVVTVLKEIRVTFTGQYGDASELLRRLMRGGVQVVSFGESPEDTGNLIIHSMTTGMQG